MGIKKYCTWMRPLQIYGTGNQTRTFCYITDAMEGFIRVILNGVPGEAYNIGNPNPEISVIELIEKIEFILGKKVKYNIVDYPDSYPADEPNRRCPDILKAKRQIKYQPKIDINEAPNPRATNAFTISLSSTPNEISK